MTAQQKSHKTHKKWVKQKTESAVTQVTQKGRFWVRQALSQSQAQQGSTATAPPGHTFTHNGPMMAHR